MKYITIQKRLVSKKKGIVLVLKDSIRATYNEDDAGYEVVSSHPSFVLFLEKESHDDNEDVGVKLRDEFINIYRKGVENINNLNSHEMNIFYFINKIIHPQHKAKHRTLIIGYVNSYMENIQSTTMKFLTECDNVKLKKNLEMYPSEEFSRIYHRLISRIAKGKYNKYIIDIPCMFIDGSEYNRTKKIIKHIEKTAGSEILFLVEPTYFAVDRFLKVFGEEYKDHIVFKQDYIRPSKQIIRHIGSLMYK